MGDRKARMPTTLCVTRDEMAARRTLSAALGLYSERGPGHGHLGKTSTLMRAIAQAYAADPEGTRALPLRLLDMPGVE